MFAKSVAAALFFGALAAAQSNVTLDNPAGVTDTMRGERA